LAEQNALQTTRATLLTTQNNLTTVTQNSTTVQNNTVLVNNQLTTVQQELKVAEVFDMADMACPTFSDKQLEDAIQHVKSAKLWIACKKLPARAAAVGNLPVDAESNTAEISYFASTLRAAATFWFNGQTMDVDPANAASGVIRALDALCTAFQAHYLFDPAQK